MAVIHDLPAELLRRILKLLRDDLYAESFALGRTSLVARAWRHPSQALLMYHMDLDRHSPAVLGSNAGCTIRHVRLVTFNAWARLDVLKEYQISVETLLLLHTRPTDIDLGGMDPQLFARLKSLNIKGEFAGQPTLPMGTNLELTHIDLSSRFLPSLSFLDSIFPSAPFLTFLTLELGDDGDLFTEEYAASFHAIAHQLRHLRIDICGCHGVPTSRPSPAVTRFVASCTSLRSLDLYVCSTAYLNDVVSAATRAPLAVLETMLALDWNKGGTGVAELAAILELPAMTNLRRWRMAEWNNWGQKLPKDERAQWEAACRARGVEPRDGRRFFTDHPTE